MKNEQGKKHGKREVKICLYTMAQLEAMGLDAGGDRVGPHRLGVTASELTEVGRGFFEDYRRLADGGEVHPHIAMAGAEAFKAAALYEIAAALKTKRAR